MNNEKLPEVYSLHRYVNKDGTPNSDEIFTELDSEMRAELEINPDKIILRRKHLNPDLMRIWTNQPDEVQKVIEFHLGICDVCKRKYEVKETTRQGNLPY